MIGTYTTFESAISISTPIMACITFQEAETSKYQSTAMVERGIVESNPGI